MKQKVKFSKYSIIATAVVLILFLVGILSLLDNSNKLIIFCVIFGAVTFAGLYYCPKSVEANESNVTLHHLLSSPTVFPYSDIQAVDTFYPSAGGLRLCASGGYFGYWGYFNDIMVGSYVGCYGSRSNCILIRLKNGKQYVIGCENAVELVNYINSQHK